MRVSERRASCFFPELSAAGGSSALFTTYMPGPEHGAIDSAFAGEIWVWIRQYPVLHNHFATGHNSGGYGHYQPDNRLFPPKRFRDRQRRDADKHNKGLPYSRLICEVEYKNRDPVKLRQRGMVYYMKRKYTRLFLGAKLYAPDESGEFELMVDTVVLCVTLWFLCAVKSILTTVVPRKRDRLRTFDE